MHENIINNAHTGTSVSGETGQAHEKVAQHQAETAGITTMDNEFVLENRHPGWGMWWKNLAAAGFLFLIFLASGEIAGVFAGLVISGILVGYVAFARSQSRYIVTDERVKMDIGFIRNHSREYRISDIRGIDTSQSILDRIFSMGNIEVRTGDGTTITWWGVPDHETVALAIREQQRQFDASMDRK